MAAVVTGGAAEFEFVDDGVAGDVVVGDVVVFVQVVATAVHTAAVAFFHDPFLAHTRVALPARRW